MVSRTPSKLPPPRRHVLSLEQAFARGTFAHAFESCKGQERIRHISFPREQNPSQTTLDVRVTPGAARDQVVGWSGGVLRLRVSAPPVEGKANVALTKLLAKTLGVPKGRIAVVRGLHDRNKQVVVEGLLLAEIRGRIDC